MVTQLRLTTTLLGRKKDSTDSDMGLYPSSWHNYTTNENIFTYNLSVRVGVSKVGLRYNRLKGTVRGAVDFNIGKLPLVPFYSGVQIRTPPLTIPYHRQQSHESLFMITTKIRGDLKIQIHVEGSDTCVSVEKKWFEFRLSISNNMESYSFSIWPSDRITDSSNRNIALKRNWFSFFSSHKMALNFDNIVFNLYKEKGGKLFENSKHYSVRCNESVVSKINVHVDGWSRRPSLDAQCQKKSYFDPILIISFFLYQGYWEDYTSIGGA